MWCSCLHLQREIVNFAAATHLKRYPPYKLLTLDILLQIFRCRLAGPHKVWMLTRQMHTSRRACLNKTRCMWKPSNDFWLLCRTNSLAYAEANHSSDTLNLIRINRLWMHWRMLVEIPNFWHIQTILKPSQDNRFHRQVGYKPAPVQETDLNLDCMRQMGRHCTRHCLQWDRDMRWLAWTDWFYLLMQEHFNQWCTISDNLSKYWEFI